MLATIKRKLFRIKQLADRQSLRTSFLVRHELEHRKLGTEYGGWFIPGDLLSSSSVCYCFGAGEDVSFDVELIARFGCQVFTFDPTPRAIAHVKKLLAGVAKGAGHRFGGDTAVYDIDAPSLGNLHFHEFGVWREDIRLKFYGPRDKAHVSHSILNLQNTTDGFEAQCYTLKTIMDKLGHDTVDLVKLDVEGAEYAVIDHMIESALRPRVICIEFDEGPNPKDGAYIERIRNRISALQECGYVITHIDRWNFTFVIDNLVHESAS